MDRSAPVVVRKILLGQLAVTAGIFLFLLGASRVMAYSALVGGTIGTLANLYSATRIFAPYRAQQPQKLLMRFYGTAITKFLLTIFMFAGAVFWMDPLSIPAMFGSYLAVQLVPVLVTGFD